MRRPIGPTDREPSGRAPLRGGGPVAEVGVDQQTPDLKQTLDQHRLACLVGGAIRDALDHDAEQLGDGVADRVLADGQHQAAGIMPKDELLEGRLTADRAGVGRVAEAALANTLRGLHKDVVEEQDRFDLTREVDIRQDLGVAAGDLREEGAVEVEKATEELVVRAPKGGVGERRDPAPDLPAG